MDPHRNPFSPGAGSPPPELVGREETLAAFELLLSRVSKGRSEKSLMLTGLRGVGKTVLLNEMRLHAEAEDCFVVHLEAHDGKPLGPLITSSIRSILLKLDRFGGAKQGVRRGFAVLKSFISSVKVTYEEISFGLDIDPEPGTADSGDLELDLPDLLNAVALAAAEKSKVIALLIDELQYFNEVELSALIMAMHRMQQRQLPLILVGAGLPILPRLAGESKSYAERLFHFPDIGPLAPDEVRRALHDPIVEEGATITESALDEILAVTKGYPYFVQEWGYQVWNTATANKIEKADVTNSHGDTVKRLDQNFFRVRFDRLTPSEKEFLRAMAELGSGPYRIGEIAEVLGIQVGSLSPRRAKLIHKAMIYSPSHGDLEFTVPLFDQFMKREIPEFTKGR
ncbi:MAG: ATP-binding protein [Verrucomicrobiota bacterium]